MWVYMEPSLAFSVGRLRGAALLGQPLDVAIALQAAPDEDVVSLCVAADVLYGESSVEGRLVSARIGMSGSPTDIRVTAAKPIDEPVVTVYLRLGCQQQSTRKYVLLAEYASEVVPPKVVLTVPRIGAISPASVDLAVDADRVLEQKPTVSRLDSGRKTKATERTVKELDAKPAAAGVPVRRIDSGITAARSNGFNGRNGDGRGARLKLLPLDVTERWEPSLRVSNELSGLPSAEGDSRRMQAQELWRVINATPEELLQDAAKRMALEAELKALVEVSHANQRSVADLNSKLKAAQERRLSNPAVFALLVLLLVCGLFIGYLYRGQRRAGAGNFPWWEGKKDGAGGFDVESGTGQESAMSAGVRSASPAADQSALPVSRSALSAPEVDIPLSDSVLPTDWDRESKGSLLAAGGSRPYSGSGPTRPGDFAHSVTGTLRAINTQEMIDVRQQADFFLALGQHDEAVGLLYESLNQSTDSNPLVYLDLIELLHKLSRKDEYEKVRRTFNALYTCYLPEYGDYLSEGKSLLDYPDFCTVIEGLWPSQGALEYIEHCMVREAFDSVNHGIEPDAFKDLLLLHGMLSSGGMAVEASTASTIPQRNLPLLSGSGGTVNNQIATRSPSSRLDLDLSD